MYNEEFQRYRTSAGQLSPADAAGDSRRAPASPELPARGRPRRATLRAAALLLVCAVLSAACGFGGAALQRRVSASAGDTAVIYRSDRPDTEVKVQQVTGKKQLTAAQVYAAAVNSVVSINSAGSSYNIFGQSVETSSSGTGFLITADGYILTNQHVVSGADTVRVTLYDGRSYSAAVIGGDRDYDVAVVKIDAEDLTPAVLGGSGSVNVGDTVLAIGNPLGELTFSMSQGIVSCCDRAINVDGVPFNMIQVDASINPGNSGGPLMNLYGEVVGVVSAKYSAYSDTAVEGLGFAIPISDVTAILSDIMENGSVTNKAYLAITAGTMTAQMAAQYAMDVTEGVFVYSVEPGGAGERAGLQMGDVITAVDGASIASLTDLSAAKKNYRSGDAAALTVIRAGESLTLELTFDAQPQTTGGDSRREQSGGYSGRDPYSGQDPYEYYGRMPGMGDLFDYFFGSRGYGG